MFKLPWDKVWFRVFWRFAEIFIISGLIGLLTNPDFNVLVPSFLTGVIAATVKALRELK